MTDGFLLQLTRHEYMKKQFEYREQTRWDLSGIDDAITLLLELQELEWRYHHLAMLEYRNHHYSRFHTHWGLYWGCKTVRDILFPYMNSHDTFSRVLRELDRDIKIQDDENLEKFRGDLNEV